MHDVPAEFPGSRNGWHDLEHQQQEWQVSDVPHFSARSGVCVGCRLAPTLEGYMSFTVHWDQPLNAAQ